MLNNIRCYFFIGAFVLVGLVSSCNNESKESFIENFKNFMIEVNTGAQNYSEADWQIADEQFTDFRDNQFPMWESLMSQSEKAQVNEMIGKYQAIQVKRGIKDFRNEVENVIDQTKTMFEELATDTTLLK